ncbi:MAG: dephospho-CoA kinase [Candidatus Marinimicrobia bacterium]|nr:dephospho-CoA kinase [Candidatus Neomarinimicrobiota bacterium]|tara:strand:+ start:3604 stop:4203 length:600 start_codon:yes stop_codon:yes gene_type:complete
MYKLAITGGIGAGKTTASEYLNSKSDSIYLFNADKESKKLLKRSLLLQNKIITAFGSNVTYKNKLDIKKLAEVAFSSKIDQEILNGIMWAEVFILINKKIDKCKKDKKSLFILDAAMIFEAKLTYLFDYTLVITATKKTRLDRAIKRHNIPLEQIKNRMSLQLSDKKKVELSDYSIINNDSIESLFIKIDNFYNKIISK